jgi:dienelactone hydrolase
MVVGPVGLSYWSTHAPRATVRAADFGVPYEEVAFTTSDGLIIAGWYVPSRNGAAVIAYPGRSGPIDHARMLARHGYGVLLFDARGEGESEGDPNAFGWGHQHDLLAALDFLAKRPDVEPGRVGGIGLSVGGEMLLHTAAETDALAAVVSEGAGIRSYREQLHIPGAGKWLQLPIWLSVTAATAVFANELPPPYLGDLIAEIAPRPVFLIYARRGQGGEELNPTYAEAGGPTTEIWEITDAGHIQGLDDHPEEYERRVIGFFDRALLADEDLSAAPAPSAGRE